MQIVTTFDPSVSISGSFTVPHSSEQGKTVLYNESNIGLILKFQNGYSDYLPAWTAIIYCGNFGGNVVKWTQQSVLNSTGSPISLVIVETYSSDECVLNIFPATLARQANVGNTVSVSVVGVSTLVNDGNAANTQFIEATVLGDSSSAVSLTNNAVFKLGTAANPGSVSFDNGGITSNGAGTLTAAHISTTTPLDSLGGLPGDAGFSTRFGTGLHGTTDVGFESATFAVVSGESGMLLKQNNYYNGTAHLFITANPAYQFDVGGAVSGIIGAIAVRKNTNTPSAGTAITWGSWSNVAGGGATSITNTGNTAGTNVLSSTVSGDGTPAVTLTNDGTLTIGNGTHNGIVSLDNGGIKTDGSGNLTTANLTSSGLIFGSVSASVQTLASFGTITISSMINRVTATANVTNMILPAGTRNGQICAILNQSTFTITFDTNSISHVSDGTNVAIHPFSFMWFIYNSANSNWSATK